MWADHAVKVLGPLCANDPHGCPDPTPAWWLCTVVAPLVSACCAVAVIISVLSKMRRRNQRVRMGPERLMTQLVLMVAITDLYFSMLWCLTQYDAKNYHMMSQRAMHFSYTSTHTLQLTCHLMLALQLYAWTVHRASPVKLSQRFPRRVALMGVGVMAVSMASSAFLAHREMIPFHSLVGPVLLLLILFMYLRSITTTRDYLLRKISGWHRSKPHRRHLARMSSGIRSRLFKYTLIFLVVWGLDSVVFWSFTLFPVPPGVPVSVWILMAKFLMEINKSLVGIYDALVFYLRPSTRKRPPFFQPLRTLPPGATSFLSSSEEPRAVSLEPHLEPRSVYVTTYNMGGATGVEPGQLMAWVPLGYDMYAIGVQECAHMADIKAAILSRLGGTGKYKCFSADIGDSTILLGKIAILFFGRAADVESGALKKIGMVRSRINGGRKLGIGRAANKGMVGLSLRYHDTTFAFITAHYAADKKGRSGSIKRLRDANKTLRNMVLVSEDTEYDAHLQCHHVVVMGDLNFRVQESPEWVVLQVQQSVQWEIEEHQRVLGGYCNGGEGSWRGERRRAFTTLPELMFELETQASFHGDELEVEEDVEAARNVNVDEVNAGGEEVKSAKGDCEGRSSSLPVVATSSRWGNQSAMAWSWVMESDELSLAMSDAHVFSGFQEQTIRFPPSFKWVKGADAHDFKDVDRVMSLYQLRVKESKVKDLRPPSYTDRILVHSLPDVRPRLTLGAYDLIEAVTPSDHRPVALNMTLLVQPTVFDFETYDDNISTLVPPTIYRCEIALSSFVVDILNSAGGRKTEQSIVQVCVHYPLVSEDPLASKRQKPSLDEVIYGESDKAASSSHKRHGLTFSAFPPGDGPDSPPRSQLTKLKNHFSFKWSEVAGPRGGAALKFGTMVALSVSHHALIKLVDGQLNDLGQAVVCLRPLVEQAMAWVEGEETRNHAPLAKQAMTVDLSVGGALMGVLNLEVSLHSLEEAGSYTGSNGM